ncbi:MAG: cell division protein FtsQ/DivIB [Elusimicrobiota bacterium]|nr:cell division protein FtsQ/DivIB [Elusimicrobiota bacterium]
MAVKRRSNVRMRGKVRNQLLRRGGAAAGIAMGLLLAFWFFGAGIKASRQFLEGRIFSFRPDSFEITCPSPEVALSLRELADSAVKFRLSRGRCAEMEREIKRRYPGLASVKVSRNFFTGRAGITAVPEEVVSAVLADGATAYLGTTGRLMPEKLTGSGADPFAVELAGAPGEAPELAAFLAALKPLAGLFYSRPLVLSCDGRSWDCRLKLEDGTTVLWGKFEFTRLKVLRLNEVMKDAFLKTSGPLRADLRSFREGKIFVSAAK